MKESATLNTQATANEQGKRAEKERKINEAGRGKTAQNLSES